ncbi:MAG: glutaredoxin family protein [Candidatus Krumholzibacteriota bacterium]|nr:glutaredoxin family protein [Candidatus Krumholzibacteriota bacterium]
MYTISTCSHCRAAKRFMEECGVPYEFVDVDLLEQDEKKKAVDEIKELNPRRSYPTIVIGGDVVIVGFREDEIRKALKLP